MMTCKPKRVDQKGCFNSSKHLNFTGELALGLWAATPNSKNPADAIIRHARKLVRQAGLGGPPFRPAIFAPLRKVTSISYKEMQIDGRLLPHEDGFSVELKKSQRGRENFTLAHEIAHTFFFELVPTVKYRKLYSLSPVDNEEESLCNMAAAELLMPFNSIATVARDYSPTLESLKSIAQIYETSLAATVLRLTITKLWNIKFILWQFVRGELVARWFAQPGRGFDRSPLISVENLEQSSIRTTLTTGKPTEAEEWLCFDRRFKLCRISSMVLPNSTMVLSTIGAPKSGLRRSIEKTPSDILPIEYECTCFGTGTRLIERDGLTYATKCLASHHLPAGPEPSVNVVL
jgi:hypothetical protein